MAMLTSRTEPGIPLTSDVHACLYYDSSLCIGSDTVGAIAAIIAAVGQIIDLVIKMKESGGNDEDDEVLVIEGDGDEDNGDCLRANGGHTEWYGCASSGGVLAAEEWIEVPTGAKNALANQWYYNEGEAEYLQAVDPGSGADLDVAPVSGSEDLRTWYFPSP
jgi:hypothetical protein